VNWQKRREAVKADLNFRAAVEEKKKQKKIKQVTDDSQTVWDELSEFERNLARIGIQQHQEVRCFCLCLCLSVCSLSGFFEIFFLICLFFSLSSIAGG
jgi:hypothetical protein